jgi:membrane protease YdiL (CAAX protease family)
MSTEPLRLLGPLVLALVSATAFDQLSRARGLEPPGFRQPWRRVLGLSVLAGALYVGVFAALGQVGLGHAEVRVVSRPELFALHALFLLALGAWLLLGFAGELPPGRSLGAEAARQLGLSTPRPLREVGIGFGLGLLAWPALLLGLVLVAAVLFALGVQNVLPSKPPALIVWIAELPVALKVAVALSAGVVEEAFFRGFLQPRTGIAVSTLLFVLAHLSYDQPFMLVGITLLSLFFAALVHWRQNLWPAIAAHFLFDAAQLVFLIPWAIKQWPQAMKGLGPVWLPW